jgi:hypothetical protein
MNKILSKLFAAILVTTIILGAIPLMMSAKAQSWPPASPSFYVVPQAETFTTGNGSIGTLFNVTVWASAPNGTNTWSVQLGFNASQLQVVGVGFTGGGTSLLFAGHSTVPLGPLIDNTGGSVEISETLIGGSDYVGASSKSLFYVTFSIAAAPATGQTLKSLIDPAFGLPPVGETLFILQSPTTTYPTAEIDYPNTAPCAYAFIGPSAPPVPLTVSINPPSSYIIVGQTVAFTSSVTGGVSPYTYIWYLNGSAVLGATLSTWNYTPASTGFDTVYLSVSDSNGTVANSNVASVTVSQLLVGTTLYVNPANIFSFAFGPGYIFSVNVTVSNVTNMGLCAFNLTYDSSVLSCIGIRAYQVQGQYPVLSVTMDGGAGYAWVSLNYSTPVNTVSAPLVGLYFYVASYGITPLNLTNSQVLDIHGNPISHSQTNGLFANIIRDVAVVNVVPSANLTLQGLINNINVTVANLGNVSETFTASAYYNSTLIGSMPITGLASKSQLTVTIPWNTTGVPEGNYTITGVASTVPYESNLANNVYVDGVVQIITLIQHLVITSVVPLSNLIFQGQIAPINVTVENLGNRAESFDVNASYDLGLIGTQHVTNLASGASITLTFLWDTTLVPLGNYTLTGACTTLPYETNATSNVLTYSPVEIALRDLAVTNVTTLWYLWTNFVYQGDFMQVNVTSENLGSMSESFNVSAYYNTTKLIGTQFISNLAPLASVTVTFEWNTTGVPYHNYTITGFCTILPGDANMANNSFNVNNVTVRIPGDVNGDGTVDVRDMHIIDAAYGTSPGMPSWNPLADVNGDGRVDIRDAQIVAKYYGTTATY